IDGFTVSKVEIKRKPNYNENIIGRDVPKKSLVLKEGERIKHFHFKVLSMLGKSNILVYKRPSIGIMSISYKISENRDNRDKLFLKKIINNKRNKTKCILINLIKNFHYEANDCGIAEDNPDAIKQALEQSFTCNDVIITDSSMEELDMLKCVLVEDFQATIHFSGVKMKSGKDTTFATLMYNG
ncbi:unnamed protein product, partial [Phyllotreta striolata]